MTRTLAFISLGVFLIALLGALNANQQAIDSDNPANANDLFVPRSTASSQAALRTPVTGQLIGSALNLYHTEQLHLYHDALEQMAATGFNAVQIVTPMFQDNGASATVQVRRGPGLGPSQSDIVSLLSHARQLGLSTMLMPQINFKNPRGNEWRGKLQPEYWGPWWDSYRHTIHEFLEIAEANQVDVFVIGCELLTTHKPEHEARWSELITHAKQSFTGKLTYSTTWDTYHKVRFWDELDAVGVSGYWDITTLAEDPEQPTDEELAKRWTQIKQRLLAFAESQNKPVLLTEVGYPSLPWALTKPWNYINKDKLPPDNTAQAKGYAAFISAWRDTLSPSQAASSQVDYWDGADPVGVFFHKWDPYHRGGPADYGYGVAGKPAYQHLAYWLRR